MSYRRPLNSHDGWIKYCDEYSAVLAKTGVPDDVFSTEERFTDFLTSGRDRETNCALGALSDEQFWHLFDLATSRFDMQTATFTACEARRLRGASEPS